MNSGNFVNALNAVNIGSLHIDKPIMLLIVALPLVVLFTLPFALVTRKENVNGHSIASYIMHIVLAAVIGFAAAGTSWITTLTETDVYVVADVSYSANKNLGEIDNIIKNRIILPRNSKLGVVCFGKDYELLCDLGSQKDAVSVKNSTVDDSETNIAEALSYAGSLFKENVIKKIVLITDGKQTDADTYAVKRAIESLEALDIEVNAIFLDDNFDPSTPEVQISGAEFTRSAFLNHEEWAYITVQTSYATRALMTLSSGGVQLQEKLVDLEEGNNRVSFSLDTSRSGTFDYVVRISAQDDASEYNNSYSFTQTVSSDMRVLIISGSWTTCKTLVNRYAESATIDAYENDLYGDTISRKTAFWNSFGDNVHGYNCNTEVSAQYYSDVPYTVEQLCKYDEIILAEIDITKLSNCTEFIRNLDTAVSLFGKSLVTVGNVYTQDIDLGSYDESAKSVLSSLDSMLPVRYGQSSDAPKLYTLVLDASRSMSDATPARLAMEKQIAVNILSALNDTDEVCIVVFYGKSYVMQMPVSLDRRDAIIDSINDLKGIQGTVIGGGLSTAYSTISGLSDYAEKQVMLISDFLDSDNEYNPISDAAKYYSDYEIVTSCVNLNKYNSSAVYLANMISRSGGGKAFHYSTSDNLGSIKFDEIVGREKEKIPSGEFAVKASRPNDDVLSGMNVTSLPTVNQFIYGSNKASTISVLQLEYRKKGSDVVSPAPLYSYWTYGNGKVSSFTSAVNGEWTDNWQQELKQVFLDNVLDTNTPSEKTDYPYVLEVQQDESYTRVQIIPADLHFGTSATIKLTRPDGEIVEESLIFDTYYYYYEFKSVDVGKYDIAITYIYNNVEYCAGAAINVSYTAEYDAFATFEPSILFKAVATGRTVITEGRLNVTNDSDSVGTYSLDFTYGLLIAAVALYVIDIIVRKLKWEDIVSFFGGMKNTKNAGDKAQ